MNRITRVMFFSNGNTAVFDDADQQVPHLQDSWQLLFLRFLTSETKCGFGPHVLPSMEDLKITMPDGRRATIFSLSDGRYSWRIQEQNNGN